MSRKLTVPPENVVSLKSIVPLDSTHVEFTDFDGLAEVAEQLGLTVRSRMSFPLPRAAGKVFPYNEFVLVASKPV